MSTFWFVIHDLMSFAQHKDMIACKVSNDSTPNRKKPKQPMFRKIRPGDKVVYYATGSYVIVGIFEIVSNMEFFSSNTWKNVFIYKIKPFKMPPSETHLDMKKILFDSNFKFDLFPSKSIWHTAFRGKTVRLLSQSDYEIFLRNINNEKYLISKIDTKMPTRVWHSSKNDL
ncbi:MAG: EVE domain-containing protein [Nitrososphaerales archaeon]